MPSDNIAELPVIAAAINLNIAMSKLAAKAPSIAMFDPPLDIIVF
jgi:hypothetical protein